MPWPVTRTSALTIATARPCFGLQCVIWMHEHAVAQPWRRPYIVQRPTTGEKQHTRHIMTATRTFNFCRSVAPSADEAPIQTAKRVSSVLGPRSLLALPSGDGRRDISQPWCAGRETRYDGG
ncbi:hypothetical protein LXA43DRAFT_395240 [Ganoderma leucocontextum]|nr:hypothetical protein LXA43DRAFT_395240 [Ganoderma leucocontextum]